MSKELLISFLNALLYDREVLVMSECLSIPEYGLGRSSMFIVWVRRGSIWGWRCGRVNRTFSRIAGFIISLFRSVSSHPWGQWDYKLKAVYVVVILNFVFDNMDDAYFHHLSTRLTGVRSPLCHPEVKHLRKAVGNGRDLSLRLRRHRSEQEFSHTLLFIASIPTIVLLI